MQNMGQRGLMRRAAGTRVGQNMGGAERMNAVQLMGRNDLCWCKSGFKYKKCHLAFDEKIESFRRRGCTVPARNMIKTQEQIEGIRESAKINIAVLDYIGEHIGEGVTTQQIDQWVYDLTTRAGGIPAPLNYEGFPTVCALR